MYRMLGAKQGGNSQMVLLLRPHSPADQALSEHIRQHPYGHGKIIPRKGLVAAVAMCDAYTVLGINKFEGNVDKESVQDLASKIKDFLNLGFPYQPLEH